MATSGDSVVSRQLRYGVPDVKWSCNGAPGAIRTPDLVLRSFGGTNSKCLIVRYLRATPCRSLPFQIGKWATHFSISPMTNRVFRIAAVSAKFQLESARFKLQTHPNPQRHEMGTPKHQTDNRPVVRLALGFFHEAPKLYSWRQHRQCELHLSEFGSSRFYHRGTRTISSQKDSGERGTLTNGALTKLHAP